MDAQQTQAAKPKAQKKPKVPKKPAQHPPYNEMIKAAINALKDRKGSSKQAIVKYVAASYKVGDNCNTQVKLQLVRMVQNKALTQTKGTGASGSFKINKVTEEAKAKKAAAQSKKKTAAATKKKTAAKPKKASSPKKKTGAKKTTVKKQTKKPAAKKPAAKKSPKKQKVKKQVAAKKPAAKKSPKKSVKKQTKKPAAKKAGKK